VKFSRIQIHCHPRSGSHYLAALIDLNFFDGSNYLRHYKKSKPHRFGGQVLREINNHPETAYVYIWRSFEPVSLSMYKMRKRFGLIEDDFDTFLDTKYSEMWRRAVPSRVKVNVLHRERVIRGSSSLFSRARLVPYEYWKMHIASWKKLEGKENVILVLYDNLLEHFQGTMLALAQALGSDKDTFLDIKEKVGWTPLS
jgi:hypothetical protein